MPVAYFLSNSNVKAVTLQLLIKAVINKLFDCGLLPKVIVCDQAPANQTVFKTLGVTKESPFFCNERKLFALFDVPHLVKSIRNNFLCHDYIWGNEQVSFSDVKNTYMIDKASKKSRSMLKITDIHIAPNSFQKMKVSLATQIFSNSVAATIKTVNSTGQLKSETAVATANFLTIVNNMFDSLNSKRKFDANPFKHALSKNSDLAIRAISDAKTLFLELKKITFKEKNGQSIQTLTRPPCFDGVVQTCEGVLQLLKEEVTEPNIKYLITGKLNQDVLENFFSLLRQKGGCNRNPSAKSLRSIFMSNLINSLLKLPESKNCEDEEVKYLRLEASDPKPQAGDVKDSYSSSSQSYLPEAMSSGKGLQASTDKILAIAGPSGYKPGGVVAMSSTENRSQSHDISGTNVTLEECSLTYFAGYLAKTCVEKFNCQTCAANLLQQIELNDPVQLLIIHKAYMSSKGIQLKMPSEDLLKLVHMALDHYNSIFMNIVHVPAITEKLLNGILDYLRCEAPKLLLLSCETHLYFIIKHLIFVKINFYCKTKNRNYSESTKAQAKLKILDNK